MSKLLRYCGDEIVWKHPNVCVSLMQIMIHNNTKVYSITKRWILWTTWHKLATKELSIIAIRYEESDGSSKKR